eukprot:1146158-Pelagomonas_calceolata.AAC.1
MAENARLPLTHPETSMRAEQVTYFFSANSVSLRVAPSAAAVSLLAAPQVLHQSNPHHAASAGQARASKSQARCHGSSGSSNEKDSTNSSSEGSSGEGSNDEKIKHHEIVWGVSEENANTPVERRQLGTGSFMKPLPIEQERQQQYMARANDY